MGEVMNMPFRLVESAPDKVQLQACLTWLEVHGFTVFNVAKMKKPPKITLYYKSSICDKLEGAVEVFQRTAGGERRYRFCHRFGCELRWYLDGGKP